MGNGGLRAAPTNGLAIAALLSGVLAWFICPVIGGVLTIQMARGARREIQLTGERGIGLTWAAEVLGLRNVLVWGVPFLALLTLALFRLVRS